MPTNRTITLITLLILMAFISGCAGDYIARTSGVRRSYEHYDHGRAIDQLDRGFGAEGSIDKKLTGQDYLLYLMDRGMILHADGQYHESNKVFHEAEQVAASLDIVSVSEEASTLTTTERRRAYRGEAFELLLINFIKALNYAALNERESALVEVRRANQRLRHMLDRGYKGYQQLAIARYIGGALWEWAGEWDSAFIDYSMALESSWDLDHLAEPALRIARARGRQNEYAELLKRYPNVPHDPLAPDEGQLLVVVGAGLSPIKRSRTQQGDIDLLAVPYYERRNWSRRDFRMMANGISQTGIVVTSVEQVAIRYFEERIARMIARGLAGTAVKAGVATAVGMGTKNEDLGLLTFYLLSATNRPDLRSWLSLPAEFQVSRMRLPAGEHRVVVAWGGTRSTHSVSIRPGEITFLPLRRY